MILKVISIALSLTAISLFVTPPANAGLIQLIKNKLHHSGIKINGTYAPTKLPISGSCDRKGNVSISLSPGLTTPFGRVGINATRKIKSFKCRGRSK